MTPEETIAAYRRQSRRRLMWFGISTAAGAVAAAVAWLAGAQLEPWKLGIVAHGVVWWPWFSLHVRRKDHVSIREVARARAEAEPR